MSRDDFSQSTKDTLAKRVNYLCSQCGQQTVGPQSDPGKAVNIGVAAHISAAAEGGPRYDSTLTAGERSSAENGIWMCQNHGKLVDSDAHRYTVEQLRTMKAKAEAAATRALESRVNAQPPDVQAALRKAEGLMPELFQEMRSDLKEQPLARELVTLKKTWSYVNDGSTLEYYYETHANLDQKMGVLDSLGLARDITFNNVKRFKLSEALTDYLQSTEPLARPASAAQAGDEFIESLGVWREPASGLHLCPKCRSDERRSPLKKEAHGYRCTACGQYFDDPSRPRLSQYPRGPRGPQSWMG
ncbi:MAG: hypothetical protein Q8O42_02645 [Acidobacteriota bacterium]|nr:hypothetical protein [Acidobacteriota bacterium]